MTLSQSNTPSTNESRTDFSTLPGACTSTMLFILIYIIVINPNNIIKHRLKPEPKIRWDDININLVVVVRLWINRSFNFNKLNWLKASSSYVNLELPRLFRFSPKKWSDCLTLNSDGSGAVNGLYGRVFTKKTFPLKSLSRFACPLALTSIWSVCT